jgi:hypothetical protein
MAAHQPLLPPPARTGWRSGDTTPRRGVPRAWAPSRSPSVLTWRCRSPRRSRPPSPARPGCSPRPCTHLPTPATSCCCSRACAAAGGDPTPATLSDTGPSSSPGHCWRPSASLSSAASSRSGKAASVCSTPAESRQAWWAWPCSASAACSTAPPGWPRCASSGGRRPHGGVRFRQHLRSTTDTAVTAVFYEDAAALLGNAIALTGLGLHQLLGSPAPDAAAGIMIGLLLASIGLRLAARNRALLTNRSESPVVLDRIRDLLVADPEVAAVGPVASVYLGPHPAPGHRRDPTAGRHLRAAPAAAPGRAPRARDGGDPARRPRLPDTGRHGRTTPGADAMGPGLLAATLPRPRAGMITGCAAAQDSQPQPGRHQRAGASGAEA